MQARVHTGEQFEIDIQSEFQFDSPQKHGFKKKSHASWTVKGKNFIEKILNSKFDPSKFELNKKKSRFYKADHAFLQNEIPKKADSKKYYILKQTFMLAEPILSVKTTRHLEQLPEIWGVCLDHAREKYNKFITEFYNTRQDIIEYIIEQFRENSDYLIGKEKTLVPIKKFNLSAKLVNNGYNGFKRIKIMAKYVE